MNPSETALLLIGFQNDYFSESGVLREAIAESANAVGTLQNTTGLIASIADTSTPILSTPIVFTEDYRELKDPIGILKTVRDSGAFKKGEPGCETVPELLDFGSRIELVMGRQTFNSFSNTELLSILQARGSPDRGRHHIGMHRFHRAHGIRRGVSGDRPFGLHGRTKPHGTGFLLRVRVPDLRVREHRG